MIFATNKIGKLITDKNYANLRQYILSGFDFGLSEVNEDYVRKYGKAENKAFDYVISNNVTALSKLSRRVLDAPNDNGYTPLHWAIIAGNNKVVRFLHDQGVRANTKTLTGENPYSLAARFNNLEAFVYLLKTKQGGFLNTNERGFNVLHFASSYKNLSIIKAIISLCPKQFITNENIYGATLLHWFVHSSKCDDSTKLTLLQNLYKIIYKKYSKRLIQFMISCKNAIDFTPLDWLEVYGHKKCYQFLKNIK